MHEIIQIEKKQKRKYATPKISVHKCKCCESEQVSSCSNLDLLICKKQKEILQTHPLNPPRIAILLGQEMGRESELSSPKTPRPLEYKRFSYKLSHFISVPILKSNLNTIPLNYFSLNLIYKVPRSPPTVSKLFQLKTQNFC